MREEICGRRDGEWRTRVRDMGSGELERGIWEVENQSEGYGEWRTRTRDMGSGELE